MKKVVLMFLVFCLVSFNLNAKSVVLESKENVIRAIDVYKKMQQSHDKWVKEKQELLKEYETLQKEVEILEYENKYLRDQKDALVNSIKKMKLEIKKTGEIKENICPYLRVIYQKLIGFVMKDLPFLKEERQARLIELQRVLDDNSTSISEKYRRTMDTLLIEAAYGRTVGVYKDEIELNGKRITGDVFRFGRIGLFFLSPDKRIVALYDISSLKWVQLRSIYAKQIKKAIEIANKIRPVTMIDLPIGKMEKNNEH